MLDFYDGATSFQGFAQAIQIATHAYINNEIVSRATALKGAQIYMHPIRQGSLVLEIIAVIEQYPAVVTLAAPVFYDFIKYSFSKAVGLLNTEPETAYVSKLSTKDEPFFDDLAEVMEGSLQRAHRPLEDGIDKITISRPRSDLLIFNNQTKEWVNTREPDGQLQQVVGNVTRFNSITGNGRIFLPSIGRVVPFRQSQDFPEVKKGYFTISLHGSNLDQEKDIKVDARHVRSATGDVKRIIIEDCNPTSI